MYEESIYNLLPKEYVAPVKPKLYRSTFDPTIAPTASTFGHHTTSIPKISNLDGEYVAPIGGHNKTADFGTFGKPKHASKPDSKTFKKKGTGSLVRGFLPPIKGDAHRKNETRKPAIPKKDEKPIMGLKTSKNYVLANKVDNMLSQPKAIEEPVDWTRKKGYGEVPKYIEQIKEQTMREYEHIRALHQQEQEQDNDQFLLSEEELGNLRNGLKNKWDVVNKEYQLLTHKTILDTIGLRRRKENCEKELSALEKDLDKLHKGYILVDTRS